MEAQEVIIRLNRGTYTVDAVFHLFNTGETRTEWIGFPKWMASSDILSAPSTFLRYQAWINGQEVKVSEEQDRSGATVDGLFSKSVEHRTSKLGAFRINQELRWLAHQVTFPGDTTTIIRITYEAPYSGKSQPEAAYIYGTGSAWKGNVGRAVFIVDSTDWGGSESIRISFVKGLGLRPKFENVSPTPRSISDSVVIYEIRDFKPHPEAQFMVKPSLPKHRGFPRAPSSRQ